MLRFSRCFTKLAVLHSGHECRSVMFQSNAIEVSGSTDAENLGEISAESGPLPPLSAPFAAALDKGLFPNPAASFLINK